LTFASVAVAVGPIETDGTLGEPSHAVEPNIKNIATITAARGCWFPLKPSFTFVCISLDFF
jgi:hypothetical protein